MRTDAQIAVRFAGVRDSQNLGNRLHEARLKAFLSVDGEIDEEDEVSALLAKAASVYTNAIAPETRKAYVRRWRYFESWCKAKGFESLPATPETVMLYLASNTGPNTGVALATLRGWAAAIARVHLEAGLASPTDDPAMSLFLKGLARMHPPGAKPEPVQALRIGPLREVIRMIHANAVDPVEVRDRAILGLHLAGIGDGEMTRLCWQQVTIADRSMTITLLPVGRQKNARRVRICRIEDDTICPVASLAAWQRLSTSEGPVFRLASAAWLGDEEMRTKRIWSIRKARLNSLGTPGKKATPQAAMRLLGRQPPMDVRDLAILLIGFAGAFRRPEVTNLRWSDLRLSEAGLVVHLRTSKTDQEGRGKSVGIPYGKSPMTCPVTAYLAWLERVTEQLGEPDPEARVFTHVGRAGRITDTPLSPAALTRMVIARAQAAGLEGKFGGRSLRAGFISTAADLEVPLEAIATQSRHATLDSLVLYVRRDDPFRRNPAGKVGL